MIKFNYNELVTNPSKRNDTLRWLLLNFTELDLTERNVNFAPTDGNFELKAIVTGNYELELDIERLLKYLMKYGNELETENYKLRTKLDNLRFKINQFIDDEELE